MRAIHQRQEHTSSWYAATANEVTRYPILEGSQQADICIIGAGFTGIATALNLVEYGYSVAIIEANRVGWGASGRNGGQLINGISGLSKLRKKYGESVTDMLWDMRWRGNTIIHDWVSKYDIDCDLKDGFIQTALKARHMADLDDEIAELQRHNFPYRYEIWDRTKTCSMLGTDAFISGFVNYRDGHLHPLNLCIGEARAACGLGARIFEQSPVTHVEHGAKAKVHTANGHVEADAVILAGNAYHLLEKKHLASLTFPAGTYIIGTETLSDELVEEINPLDLAVCDMNDVVDYYRLSTDNRLLYGGRCNYSGREPKSIKAAILPRLLKVYPQLKDVRIDFQWGGNIGIVLNRIPVLGRINKNVYYCQGYSGHGISATHTMGEVMADAVSGTMEKYNLFANVKHIRIPGSQWAGNQIMALGMLYYRLKDML